MELSEEMAECRGKRFLGSVVLAGTPSAVVSVKEGIIWVLCDRVMASCELLPPLTARPKQESDDSNKSFSLLERTIPLFREFSSLFVRRSTEWAGEEGRETLQVELLHDIGIPEPLLRTTV